MKKPFYVTIRKKKDGRQRVCIVFNNPTTGERGRVVSASSLYKAYLKKSLILEYTMKIYFLR